MAVRRLVLVAALGLCVASGVAMKAHRAPVANVSAAISRVLTMLQNLVSMMDSEGQEDESKHTTFTEWATGEIANSNQEIGSLTTEIENTNAALEELRARQGELVVKVKKLNADISAEQAQVRSATEKRTGEHEAFVKESTDFTNAIAACGKAVQLLGAHYGDGTSTEQGKPSWMSLLNEYLRTARVAQQKLGKVAPRVGKASLLQHRQPNNNAYEDSTGEALNIVDEVKVLKGTFQEDFESCKQDEAKLKASFDELIGQKTGILNTLTTERDEEQTMLNKVNQEVAENEGALAMAEESLTDHQANVKSVSAELKTKQAAYDIRKKDRDEETAVTKEAISVIEGAGSLLQRGAVIRDQKVALASGAKLVAVGRSTTAMDRLARRSATRGAAARKAAEICPNCAKAAALLREQARVLHSSVLTAAVGTTMGNEALDNVVDSLKSLIKRIEDEQKTEKDHKDWCEDEIRDTTNKKDDHATNIDIIGQVLADLQELIGMKVTAIQEKQAEIDTEEGVFEQRTDIRTQEKDEYSEDIQDHIDAIKALNEGIEILANYFKNKGAALIQSKKDGARTVEIMSQVRKEFEESQAQLTTNENEAIAEFELVKKAHAKMEADLSHDKDVLTVELQTAKANQETNEGDLDTNKAEKRAAESYLSQLGRSCNVLIEKYDERKQLRTEEKDAIKDAIKVLKSV